MGALRCRIGHALLALVAGTVLWPDRTLGEPAPIVDGSQLAADRAGLLEAHNRERAAMKLAPLTSSEKLDAAALAHARDMARNDRMTHDGSDGSTPAQRIERQGYRYRTIGENVAAGQRSVSEVMRTWMESPPHKKNILGDSTEMGSALVKSKDGTPYWSVELGRPVPVLNPEDAERELVAGLNRERRTLKKPPLKVNSKLAAAARRHAQDMAAHDKFVPRDDDGLDPFERVRKSGYRFRRLGEVTASGPPTPDEAVVALLGEETNRTSLLGEFSEIGVGYATTDKGTPYWSLLLGVPVR